MRPRVGSYADRLRDEARERGVALGHPQWDDDRYSEKLDLLGEQPVPVVSLTFGCPTPSQVDRLHSSGSAVWVTVTTVGEARAAQRAGADALVVQGVEAGGHRGGFDDAHPGDIGLLALLQLVQAAVDDGLPLVATGGLITGRGVAAVLAGGAAAAQLGTAFMLCPEAGTVPAHRDMISRADAPTALTRAFTGRTARGIVNRFLQDHSDAPSAYPEIHHLTAPLRTAARTRGDTDGFHLWAGQAHALAQPLPAADLVVRLATECPRSSGSRRAQDHRPVVPIAGGPDRFGVNQALEAGWRSRSGEDAHRGMGETTNRRAGSHPVSPCAPVGAPVRGGRSSRVG